MRNFKKALSLCLVLVMLVGTLSITAFATDTYTVKFFVNGTEQTNWQLTGNVGNSVYTTIHNSSLNDHFDPVADYYNPSVTHQALTSLQGYGPAPATINDIPASYTSVYSDIEETGNSYYYLLETGSQGYHYLYLGYAWTYHYVGGADLWDYMDSCYPAAGSVLEVVYSLQASDFWSSSDLG